MYTLTLSSFLSVGVYIVVDANSQISSPDLFFFQSVYPSLTADDRDHHTERARNISKRERTAIHTYENTIASMPL